VSELANRVLVAAVLAPLVVGAVYVGGWWTVAVAVVVTTVSLHELYAMTRPLRPIVLAGQAGAVAMVVGAHWHGVDWALAPIPVLVIVTFLLAAGVSMRESATVSVAVTVFTAIYVGLGIAFLVLLRDVGGSRVGFNVLLAVLLGTWASDIFAFFGGRLFGRHKLAPAISPSKTVEGFVCGFIFSALTVWWTLYAEQRRIDHVDAAVVGLAVAFAAPFGDLFESFLKRDLGFKDSGSLLGGHGGLLDRIDALLFAGPAAFVALDLVSRVS